MPAFRSSACCSSTYVLSGMLCAAGGIFYAARQASTDSTTGVGWEFQALTAVVLGGVSLAGGKGTVWRAMIGAHHHLRAHQRSGPHGHPGLRHLGG